MKTYYLAVDIGASSGRHILGSVSDGKIELEEVFRFPNGNEKKNGTRVWNYQNLFENLLKGLEKCKEIEKIPAFMAIDTWGVDFGLLDENGFLIGDVVAYRDKRTDGMDAEVEKIISFEELYSRTGIQKQIFNTVYQLMALKKNSPESLESADSLLMMPDLLNFSLTGTKHQEYTNASTTGLLSAQSGDWDTELINRLGYPERLFQKLYFPGERVGTLKKEIVERIGFDLTVLHAPSHDTASAVLAVPSFSENSLYISSGTWSLMGIESKSPTVGKTAREYNFTNEGGYAMRYRFLKNIMGLWIIQSIKEELKQYSFSELCDIAIATYDDGTRIDVNSPAFLAPESMLNAIREYCKRPDMTVGEILVCVYHSLAQSYAEVAAQIKEITKKEPEALHIVGGGSHDVFLNRLTKESCDIPVITGPTEATAIGNILSQMLSNGEFTSIDNARAAIRNSFNIIQI